MGEQHRLRDADYEERGPGFLLRGHLATDDPCVPGRRHYVLHLPLAEQVHLRSILARPALPGSIWPSAWPPVRVATLELSFERQNFDEAPSFRHAAHDLMRGGHL